MSQETTLQQADPRSGVVLTGLLAAATAVLIVWGQKGPGFSWDPDAASFIKDTIPGLEALAAWVAWPVSKQWPFAVAVLARAVGLSASKHPKAAVEVLGSVAGGMLLHSALAGMPMELAASKETLFYGAFFGGIALSLNHEVSAQTGSVLWGAAALLTLMPGLALVSAGHLPSAWMISVLLVASWLAGLHQMMRQVPFARC